MKRAPQPVLSVLIPTITAREEEANALYRSLEKRAKGRKVEILMLRENLLCGIGEARNKLLRAAGGQYVTFLDDDDAFCEGYFELVLAAAANDKDVITYDQWANVDGEEGRVSCRLRYKDVQPFRPGAVTKRPPWFWCAWRRELACAYAVPQVRRNEDILWLQHLWMEAETETHISQVLHRYNFSSDKTTLQKP
jgi:glycosyltransferase involved in cell wall biosynthesis